MPNRTNRLYLLTSLSILVFALLLTLGSRAVQASSASDPALNMGEARLGRDRERNWSTNTFTNTVGVPNAMRFEYTGNPSIVRNYKTTTLLPDGRALIAGGRDWDNNLLTSAEVYDPATGIFTFTGSSLVPHWLHTATLLGTGKVLLAGRGRWDPLSSSAELFDPIPAHFLQPVTCAHLAIGTRLHFYLTDEC